MIYRIFKLKKPMEGILSDSIYAYSTSKKLSNSFKKTRNMNLFNYYEEDINGDDERYFIEGNMGANLSNVKINTFDNNKYIETYILLTHRERIYLIRERTSLLHNIESSIGWLDINKFNLKHKYIKILNKLGFNYIYNYIHCDVVTEDINDMFKYDDLNILFNISIGLI